MGNRIRIGLLAGCLLCARPLDAQRVVVPDSLPPGVTPDMVERGREIFEGEGGCANCHGRLAQGYLGPNLTDDRWWHARGSYLELVSQILRGVPTERTLSGVPMAPRGGTEISDAEVQAVAAFVWTLSHPELADSLPLGVTPETVRRGDEIFHGRGQCVDCHGSDARGRVGPNLTDEVWLHAKGSYLAIVQTILTGVPEERSKSGVVMPPRGGATITDSQVYDVAAYVWALSHPNGR